MWWLWYKEKGKWYASTVPMKVKTAKEAEELALAYSTSMDQPVRWRNMDDLLGS